jgi:hypothetical protein
MNNKTVAAEMCNIIARLQKCNTPIELHGLDVEAQCGTDCGDIFVVQALDDGCLPSIIQAAGQHKLYVYQRMAVNIATDCHDPTHLHHQKSHLLLLLFNLFYDG